MGINVKFIESIHLETYHIHHPGAGGVDAADFTIHPWPGRMAH